VQPPLHGRANHFHVVSQPRNRPARMLQLGIAMLVLVSCMCLPVGPAAARGPTVSVSLGDSFISGQAGRWQGNSTDTLGSRSGTDRACVPAPLGCRYDIGQRLPGRTAPPGCARSDVAEILSARIGVQEMINVGCSGAATREHLSRLERGSAVQGRGSTGRPARTYRARAHGEADRAFDRRQRTSASKTSWSHACSRMRHEGARAFRPSRP